MPSRVYARRHRDRSRYVTADRRRGLPPAAAAHQGGGVEPSAGRHCPRRDWLVHGCTPGDVPRLARQRWIDALGTQTLRGQQALRVERAARRRHTGRTGAARPAGG